MILQTSALRKHWPAVYYRAVVVHGYITKLQKHMLALSGSHKDPVVGLQLDTAGAVEHFLIGGSSVQGVKA